jgi:Tfp pilus assembly protein PilP
MKTCRDRLVLILQCLAMLPVPVLLAQTPKSVAEPQKKAEAPVLYSSAAYQPDGRRDPFLNPMLSAKKDNNPDEEEPKGTPPPGISGMLIAQVKLLGTSFGEDSPVAVFQGPDKRAYFLQERDRLFDGYVKQVGSDSVLLVRETRLRSGKVVTQEVTKQLRTP